MTPPKTLREEIEKLLDGNRHDEDYRYTVNRLDSLITREVEKAVDGYGTMQARQDQEIQAMKLLPLDVPAADHLMVEAVRRDALPASKLPQVIQAWEKPRHEEFEPRTAWSLFNAFTEVTKSRSPQLQMDSTLRLSQVFRAALS